MTLEHILPQTPDDWWCHRFGEESTGKYVGCLDNLAFVPLSLNLESRKERIRRKKRFRAEDPLGINREITEHREWSPITIKVRQQWLARHAAKVWRLPQA
ncbi:MAG: hypothetical protein M2R45_01455 [Verrucomicrobia subdivision 3 bacterium]|nr:hypothetical protein [Limisphaerales bacterium]MCS1417600.1 hypothetical protein [Limisphaerales bacterium]